METETAAMLWAFLASALSVLAFALSGGFLMGAIDVFERWRGDKIAWRSYAIVMGLSLLLGIFVEWKIGYVTRLQLELDKANLKTENTTLTTTKTSLEKMIETLQRENEKMRSATPKSPDLAKLCFNERLPFTQTRLRKLPQNTPAGYDYVKEVKMPEFSTSGKTRLRIHVTSHVGWIDVTPKDEGAEASIGQSYVELNLSPKVVHARHWYMTLFGVGPFDVICIDRLPIRPRQD